jgi:hypothetical protein
VAAAARRARARRRTVYVSEKLPAVKPTKLIRVLEQKGRKVDRIRGSHYILVHEEETGQCPYPSTDAT